MIDPATTYIDAGVEIGKDTIIYPQTILEGDTKVGENCLLGPGLHLVDTLVGNEVVCRQSVVLEAFLKMGLTSALCTYSSREHNWGKSENRRFCGS